MPKTATQTKVKMLCFPLASTKMVGHFCQRRRQEILVVEVGFIGTHTHLHRKFSFSLDFGHFVLTLLENAIFYTYAEKKDTEKSKFLEGSTPRF